MAHQRRLESGVRDGPIVDEVTAIPIDCDLHRPLVVVPA